MVLSHSHGPRTTDSACRVQRLNRGDGGSGSHGPGAGTPRSRTPTPPLRIPPRDSLILPRATRSDLSRSQFVSGETDRILPTQETAPSFSTDGYLCRNL